MGLCREWSEFGMPIFNVWIKTCMFMASRARTKTRIPLADDQHSGANNSGDSGRRHPYRCPERNQNKIWSHALAKSTNTKPSKPTALHLGLQFVDRTTHLQGTGRQNSVSIAWGGCIRLKPWVGWSLIEQIRNICHFQSVSNVSLGFLHRDKKNILKTITNQFLS